MFTIIITRKIFNQNMQIGGTYRIKETHVEEFVLRIVQLKKISHFFPAYLPGLYRFSNSPSLFINESYSTLSDGARVMWKHRQLSQPTVTEN